MDTTTRHGTTAGWRRHQTIGEQPCDACWSAKAAYDKRRLSAPEKTRRSRLYARAQGRAVTEMRSLYPGVWAALYEKHKAAIFAEDAEP